MATPARVYIRLVCFQQVDLQRQRLGLFQALEEAKTCDFAAPWAVKEIGELSSWFRSNLAVPDRFERSGWKGRGQPGLSWFKPAASDHIRQMRRLKLALEACGVHVDILTTRDPGQIVWQDENQVVAEPGPRKF